MTEPSSLLTPDEWAIINNQRLITAQINKDVVKVGAVYLRPTSKIPANDDWAKSKYLDTDLRIWIDHETYQHSNVGFNLQNHWADIDVDGTDPEYSKGIHAGLKEAGVDCRLAFGRLSAGVPRHFLIQLSEEEANLFNDLKRFQARPIQVGTNKFNTEIRYSDKAADAKQTVVPGSLYGNGDRVDISVWWTEQGRIAQSIGELTQTTPRITAFDQLLRGIAFGTILYLIRHNWTAGTRQHTALKFCGWLARTVDTSFAMNNSEQLALEIRCPIDCDEVAEKLIEFICRETGDDEAYMRKRAYKDARDKLSRNPDAKIPGRTALIELLGIEIVEALKAVCIPNSDFDPLFKLIERYVYNEDDGRYVDRERHEQGHDHYEHKAEDLIRRHKEELMLIGGKFKEAFIAFERDRRRIHISNIDLYPDKAPHEILRVSRSRGFVTDDDEGVDISLVYNSWRGWDHKPPAAVDIKLLAECETKLDKLLNLITCDKPEHIQWIKEWIAWTIQHPGEKQQIALVVIGDQGVGKSFFGDVFCGALFGSWHGKAEGKQIGERFGLTPFIDKMFVFIDEAKLRNVSEEIRALIRSVKHHGERKGLDSRDYNIYARLMFASNDRNVRISQQNVIDRGLYYVKAYSAEYRGISQVAFNEWALTLKPFFDDFGEFLKRHDVISAYMRYFMQIPVDRHRIEDITHSSSHDVDIRQYNMSSPRRIAKMIIESGHVFVDLDISAPFTDLEFKEQVAERMKKINDTSTKPDFVFNEIRQLNMLEQVSTPAGRKWRFRWMIGELTTKFSEAIGVPCEPQFEFGPGDFGANTNDGMKPINWKGSRRRF